MSELWKDIKGLENQYQISSYGRVIRISKYGLKSFSLGSKDAHGYITVTIKGKIFKIHRLVAEAFLPNPENKKTVNHKNGCKTHNHISNLEWATQSENNKHAFDNGLKKPTDTSGSKNPNYKNGSNIRGQFNKVCENCGNEFIAKMERNRFCSKTCKNKKMWENIKITELNAMINE